MKLALDSLITGVIAQSSCRQTGAISGGQVVGLEQDVVRLSVKGEFISSLQQYQVKSPWNHPP